jgi:hypothetical protein
LSEFAFTGFENLQDVGWRFFGTTGRVKDLKIYKSENFIIVEPDLFLFR